MIKDGDKHDKDQDKIRSGGYKLHVANKLI